MNDQGQTIEPAVSFPYRPILLLMLAVIYHGVNGLRITLMDWRPGLWKYQKELTWATFVLTAVLYVPAFVIMGRHALKNLYNIEIF